MPEDSRTATAKPLFAPEEAFLECVHCGLCLQSCPTYLELAREPDSPRGRIYLMRALSQGKISLDREALRHLDLCLGCRGCDSACPSGVRYGSLLEQARAWVEESRRRPLHDRLRRRSVEWLFASPRRLARATDLLRLAERARLLALARRLVPRRSSLAYLLALLPEPLPRPRLLSPWLRAQGKRRGAVGFLEGCVMPVLFADTNERSVELLSRAGFEVHVPQRQSCCGAVFLHGGNRAGALALARQNLEAFGELGLDYVVTNAAGCGAMLKQYGELLARDERYKDQARAFSIKVRDIHEVLAECELRLSALPARRVAYHDPCHLAHAQGIRAQPRQLLGSIAGVEVIDLDDAELCCGSAGDYNLLQPKMARRLVERKAAAVGRAKADVVVAPNPGCALQISAGLKAAGLAIPVKHTVDILAEACRSACGSSNNVDGR